MQAGDCSGDALPGKAEIKTDREHTRPIPLRWQRLGFGALILISALLDFFQINQLGYGNEYYAAAVKSMLQNWHAFFFVSFDSGGFVAVDKPPLGLWLQAASATLFGFRGWSLLLPQALAGVGSVIILYLLVRRIWGPLAGLLAALALALSPVSVVMSRSNNLDGLLVFSLLLAAWALCRAAESGRLRWLLLCAFLVSLGFQIKMLEAYLVVPALSLVYLLGAPGGWWRRTWHLSVTLVMLLLLSLSWITIVDLTPASQRPYVGSSQTNSELELAFGYNGLERLLGSKGVPADQEQRQAADSLVPENGWPGLFRLVNQQLGSQVGWLLPLAILGLVVACWQTQWRWPLDRQPQSLILWGIWLLGPGSFFSMARFYHSYYLTVLAPAICALTGIGVLALWRAYQRQGWRRWLLPATLVATALVQAGILSHFPAWSAWLIPLVVGWCLIAALLLGFAHRLFPLSVSSAWNASALALGVLTLLVAPLVWDLVTLQQMPNPAFPTAGPLPSSATIMPFTSPFNGSDDTALEHYLLHQQGHTPYLLATLKATTAASLILETGQPVLALGGYEGNDPILATPRLSELIANGTVRFFLLPDGLETSLSFSGNMPSEKSTSAERLGQNGTLVHWVQENCAALSHTLWQFPSLFQWLLNNGQELYDCRATPRTVLTISKRPSPW